MDQDPACEMSSKEPNLSEGIIVSKGKLENVFIYVKQGLENYALPKRSAPAVLDQRGCRYVPHVLGMVAGQTLRVLNSDKAEHNVHPMPRDNTEWNESQMPGGAPKEHVLEHPELLLPITCNQHPWMKMYVNVVSNPFFAVSDGQGRFSISGLPPGEYTIEAVHEKLGTQSAKVKVETHQAAAADFTFKPQ
jgi:plastocyanin